MVKQIREHVSFKRGFNRVEMPGDSICKTPMRTVQRSSETISGAIHLKHISAQISKVNVASEMMLLHDIAGVAPSALACVKLSKRVENALRLNLVFH
jgi:hypothetical protein